MHISSLVSGVLIILNCFLCAELITGKPWVLLAPMTEFSLGNTVQIYMLAEQLRQYVLDP